MAGEYRPFAHAAAQLSVASPDFSESAVRWLNQWGEVLNAYVAVDMMARGHLPVSSEALAIAAHRLRMALELPEREAAHG